MLARSWFEHVRLVLGRPAMVVHLLQLSTLIALVLGPVQASMAQALVLVKQREPSPTSEVSERVVREAFARANLQVSFRPLPLPRAIEVANDGDADGDLMRIADVVAKYPNLVRVPTPLITNQLAIYGTSPALEAMSRVQVANLKVGYTRGTLIVEKYSKGLHAAESQSIDSTFEMLTQGRFDAVMGSYFDAEAAIALRGQRLYRWPFEWAAEPLYLVLHQRNAALIPRIDLALRQMSTEGLIERYYHDKLRELGIKPLLSRAQEDSGTSRGK